MTYEEHLQVCDRKVTYYTLEQAIEAEDHALHEYLSLQEHYLCPICNHYHLRKTY